MATHELHPTPENTHFGYYDYRLKPVLTVASGDRVKVRTVSANPAALPEDKSRVPKEVFEIFEKVRKGVGPHMLFGPIEVQGAEPGDVLEVHIEEIDLVTDWGYNQMRVFGGALPEDFPYTKARQIDLDLKKKTAKIAPGWEVPLKPFFGQIGVCPPESYGEMLSNPPWVHGGNFDNKDLVAGATVYLPVHKKGAGLSVGDGHACQGDGEVDQTAIETSLQGTFRLTVRKDLKLTWPRAETPTHYITMGFDRTLDEASKIALREMIDYLVGLGLGRDDAYVFCSAAVDLRITQVVNGNKGVHATVEKVLLPR